MTPKDFVLTLFADVPPPYMVGSTEFTAVTVVLMASGLALIGYRLYRSKKK